MKYGIGYYKEMKSKRGKKKWENGNNNLLYLSLSNF